MAKIFKKRFLHLWLMMMMMMSVIVIGRYWEAAQRTSWAGPDQRSTIL